MLQEERYEELFGKCSILFKFEEGENFNHRHTLSIPRIELKLHFVQNVEPDKEIGQKGTFCKGLRFEYVWRLSTTLPGHRTRAPVHKRYA